MRTPHPFSGISRRRFLASALSATAAFPLPFNLARDLGKAAGRRKLVVVLFGGGTRSLDTIDDPAHRLIPRVWNELVPNGTLFTNMRVERKVVHPNSAASIVTGHWEWDDLNWTRPPEHPTLFELLRKARSTGDTSAWAFVYASILSQIRLSRAPGYGMEWAAALLQPPTIPRTTAETADRLLRAAAATGNEREEQAAARECAERVRATSRMARVPGLSRAAEEFVQERFATWQASTGTTSHDVFLCDSALACMRRFAPDFLFVAFGEIDCAHYGSWSRYADAIRQTDELTCKLWTAVQELPQYREQTLFLVLPDHGRELEREGGAGFIHHGDFYTNAGADEGCRRVWMAAAGPGVPRGRGIERAHPITSVAATAGSYLGLTLPPTAAAAIEFGADNPSIGLRL